MKADIPDAAFVEILHGKMTSIESEVRQLLRERIRLMTERLLA